MTDLDEPQGFAHRYASRGSWTPTWVYERLGGNPEAVTFYTWLNIYVIGQRQTGYKRTSEMAEMLGISERQVKRRIALLRAAGVVRVVRHPRRDGKLGQNVYEMVDADPARFVERAEGTAGQDQGSPDGPWQPPQEETAGQNQGSPHDPWHQGSPDGPWSPPAETSTRGHAMTPHQGSPDGPSINPKTTSTHKDTPSPLRGSGAALRAAEQQPLIPDEVIDAEEVDDRPLPAVQVPAVSAGTLVKTMVDGLDKVGVKMPGNVKARWGKEFKAALDQGFPVELILEALRLAFRERQMTHPARFGQFLVRVQTGPELPPQRLGRVDAAAERRAQAVGKTGSDLMAELMSEYDHEAGRFRR